jgi:O-antigen/teichoic acid export membrane protein
VPYTLIHALGQPKVTAFFHIFELVVYFLILYWLATKYGLLGAAIAWLVRVFIDLVLLQFASVHLLRKFKHSGITR